MEAINRGMTFGKTASVEEAMNVLFSKLDEAIDDLENGRVLTEEEFWAEIDAV